MASSSEALHNLKSKLAYPPEQIIRRYVHTYVCTVHASCTHVQTHAIAHAVIYIHAYNGFIE